MKTIARKILSIICVAAILFTAGDGVSAGAPLGGDINSDGRVNNKDLTRLFQYLSAWDVPVNADVLDVNGDGQVNNKDLTRLFQYLSGWEVDIFPAVSCAHENTSWIVTKEPSAEADGEKQLVCEYCGKVLNTVVIEKDLLAGKFKQMEDGMLALINEARAAEGVAPLEFDYLRQAATDVRVKEITQVFSHTRPNGEDFYSALVELGLTHQHTCGENIAYFGYYGADSDTVSGYTRLYQQFMNSPGHRANILDSNYTSVALSFAISGNCLYVVQMFFG